MFLINKHFVFNPILKNEPDPNNHYTHQSSDFLICGLRCVQCGTARSRIVQNSRLCERRCDANITGAYRCGNRYQESRWNCYAIDQGFRYECGWLTPDTSCSEQMRRTFLYFFKPFYGADLFFIACVITFFDPVFAIIPFFPMVKIKIFRNFGTVSVQD